MDLQKSSILLGSHKSNGYAIHRNSISIKNLNNAKFELESPTILRLTCKTCGQPINVLVRENCAYAVLHKMTPKCTCTECNMKPINFNSKEMEHFLPYIAIEEKDSDESPFSSSSCPYDDIRIEDDCDFVGDGDFEYMFSGTNDPFIGSFTDRFVTTPSAPLVL